MTKLIKSGAYATDSFTPVDDDAALPDGAIIVSLAAPPPAPERREGEGLGLDGTRAWGWGTEGAGEPLVRWGPFG